MANTENAHSGGDGRRRILVIGCGGRFRLIALIEEAAVIERLLRHLHLPPEIPAPAPRVVEPLERQALARPRHSAHRRPRARASVCPGGV